MVNIVVANAFSFTSIKHVSTESYFSHHALCIALSYLNRQSMSSVSITSREFTNKVENFTNNNFKGLLFFCEELVECIKTFPELCDHEKKEIPELSNTMLQSKSIRELKTHIITVFGRIELDTKIKIANTLSKNEFISLKHLSLIYFHILSYNPTIDESSSLLLTIDKKWILKYLKNLVKEGNWYPNLTIKVQMIFNNLIFFVNGFERSPSPNDKRFFTQFYQFLQSSDDPKLLIKFIEILKIKNMGQEDACPTQEEIIRNSIGIMAIKYGLNTTIRCICSCKNLVSSLIELLDYSIRNFLTTDQKKLLKFDDTMTYDDFFYNQTLSNNFREGLKRFFSDFIPKNP